MAAAATSSSLWRHAAFMRVWAGSSISAIGDQVTLLALPWLVLQLTHSPAQLGIVYGLQNLPFLLFTLIAGVYADRWDRRLIMLSADVIRFLALGSIPVAALLNGLTIWQIYLVAFVAGTARVWFDVAHYALLPGILTSLQFEDGNSKFFAAEGAAALLGPSLGGVLIKAFSAATAILFDAVSFLASAAALITLPSLRAQERPVEIGWRAQLAAGFRYLLQVRFIRENAIALAAFLFFNNLVDAVFVFYAQHELHLDAALTGVMFALGGLGPIAVAPLVGPIRRRFRGGQVLLTAAFVSGPLVLFFDVAPFFPRTVALVMVGIASAIGFGMGTLWNTVTVSYRQSIIAGQYMSRVNSVLRFLSWGIIPLGAFTGGFLTQLIGIRWDIAISGAGLLVFAVGLAIFSEMKRI